MINLVRAAGRPQIRSYRLSYLAGYLVIFAVAERKLAFNLGQPSFGLAAALLGLFLLLYATQPYLSRRLSRYHHLYLFGQTAIVQTLGLLRPFEDTWGLLYIPLAFQVLHLYLRRTALAWGSWFAASLVITLIFTSGWVRGLGYGLHLATVGAFFVSFVILYTQAETARRESQDLLTKLQEAHRQLQDYAAQAEQLAAIHERNRLTRELHDSVSQMIFSITLTAQAARLLLAKDPAGVPEQLDHLQELTGSALSRMRALISQWRSG
ncbi:MAG: histidine kinase dimerization/phosphoacceptor domain-containing protein [Chloroflexota bacterium]